MIAHKSTMCPIIRYWPSPWFLASPHIMSVWTTLPFHEWIAPKIEWKREYIATPDGGTSALDWAHPHRDLLLPQAQKLLREGNEQFRPILILIPGLTGIRHETYIRYTVKAMLRKKWRCVVVNHRGNGGAPLTSVHTYSAGFTGDIRTAVEHIRERYPNAPLCGIGYSLGANVLVRNPSTCTDRASPTTRLT